ncbi:MAG: hypothetical protein ACXAAH_16815 [Promethearchaeota archaeon]|jgi:uncharacterized protein YneR
MESPLNSNMDENVSTLKKTFQCDLKENTIRECILSELKDGNVKLFIKHPQNNINEEILNCLNTGIISCLQNLQLKRNDFSSVGEVTVSLNEEDLWIIKEIDIIVILNVKDKELIRFINSCLKFFRKSCRLPESVNFFASNKYEVDTLQNYKTEMEHLVNQLHEINTKTKKKNKIKLYDIFKVL